MTIYQMHPASPPPEAEFFLVFDQQERRWRIFRVEKTHSGAYFVSDGNLYFGCEMFNEPPSAPTRFTHWTLLPENP